MRDITQKCSHAGWRAKIELIYHGKINAGHAKAQGMEVMTIAAFCVQKD